MKFLPSIELSQALQRALYAGHLRLQKGQWVTVDGQRCRFVRASRNLITVARNQKQFAALA